MLKYSFDFLFDPSAGRAIKLGDVDSCWDKLVCNPPPGCMHHYWISHLLQSSTTFQRCWLVLNAEDVKITLVVYHHNPKCKYVQTWELLWFFAGSCLFSIAYILVDNSKVHFAIFNVTKAFAKCRPSLTWCLLLVRWSSFGEIVYIQWMHMISQRWCLTLRENLTFPF